MVAGPRTDQVIHSQILVINSRLMERNAAAETRETHKPRSLFERFVELVYRGASTPPFFGICLAIVLVWLISLPLWVDLKAWQVAIHTVTSVVSLLLLVLLENAGRRAEESAQEKLNVIAAALAALMESRGNDDPKLLEAAKELREAVGLEERH